MQIRRSDLIEALELLDSEEDINKILKYFSYEHFYVIYCKFWELDSDHDFLVDRNDLAHYAQV
jgi:serine/threonine-protein phosphatase 2A regulatory subunit B''